MTTLTTTPLPRTTPEAPRPAARSTWRQAALRALTAMSAAVAAAAAYDAATSGRERSSVVARFGRAV